MAKDFIINGKDRKGYVINETDCLVIEDGVTEIGAGQYCGMDSLLEIILPDSVRTIGDGSFCD